VTACAASGSKSTIINDKVAYDITRERAQEIVKSSIGTFIPGDYIHPAPADSLTSSGYVRILIDTPTTYATAIRPVMWWNV
jgi:hypothetical protein